METVKSYSKRVRTPKKFFDEIPQQTSSKKKKPKGETSTKKATTPKGNKQKKTAKDKADDDVEVQHNEDESAKLLQLDDSARDNSKDITTSESTTASYDAVVDSGGELEGGVKDSEKTNIDDGKEKKGDKSINAVSGRNIKRKGLPEKLELDKSPERIVADLAQVKTVKDMVESVRQSRSRNNSPVPEEFYNGNTSSKTGRKEINEDTHDKVTKASEKLLHKNEQKTESGGQKKTNKSPTKCTDTNDKVHDPKDSMDTDLDRSVKDSTLDISGIESINDKLKTENFTKGMKKKMIDSGVTSKSDVVVRHDEKSTPQGKKSGRKKKADDSSMKTIDTENAEINNEIHKAETQSQSTAKNTGTKRGRNKKTDELPAKSSENQDSTIDAVVQQDESINTPQSTSKRRGRQKKTDKSPAELSVNDSSTISKFGRKRKSLNYSDILKDSSEDETEETPKGRGRRAKQKSRKSEPNTEYVDDSVELDVSRSGRKRKRVVYSVNEEDNEEDTENDEEIAEQKKKKGRQKQPKIAIEDEDEENESVDDGTTPKRGKKGPLKEIKCPKCVYTTTASSAMRNHVAMIHQLLWSKEHPEGLGTRQELSVVFKIKKFLNCPKCDKRLNHLFYYYHHFEWCGREHETYTCELCGSTGLKLIWKKIHARECSFVKHELAKRHREAQLQKKEQKEKEEPELAGGKRRAAKKAMDILHDLSAEGDGDQIGTDSREQDPDADIKDISEDDDDDDDGEGEVEDEDDDENSDAGEEEHAHIDISSRRPRRRNFGECKAKGVYGKYWNVHDLMLTYAKKNLSDELFMSWLPRKQDWTPLSHSECEGYLPPVSSSVKFKRRKSEEPENLNMYASKASSGHHIFYSGTSVWKLAWCPMPVGCKTEQYIALVGKPHPQQTFYSDWCKSEPGFIQIWGTGISSNSLHGDMEPRLQYTIIHDYGQATSICWCPSGCYQCSKGNVEEMYMSRLGLLAVSFKDGSIRIFSLAHPTMLSDTEAPPTYRPTPVISLVPYRAWQEQGVVCSSFDWCSVRGHDKIVSGYTDGSIRFFSLSTASPLLILQDDPNAKMILPYHRCSPCGSMIRAVRYVMRSETHIVAGSEECQMFFMDTDDSSFFLFCDPPLNLTLSLVSSLWHPGAYQVSDDCYAMGFNKSRYIEAFGMAFYLNTEKFGERKDEILTYNMASQNACVWDIDVSNWLNHVVMGDNRGVIMGLPLQDTALSQPDTKTYKNRQILLTTSLIETEETTDTNEDNSDCGRADGPSKENSDNQNRETPGSKKTQDDAESNPKDSSRHKEKCHNTQDSVVSISSDSEKSGEVKGKDSLNCKSVDNDPSSKDVINSESDPKDSCHKSQGNLVSMSKDDVTLSVNLVSKSKDGSSRNSANSEFRTTVNSDNTKLCIDSDSIRTQYNGASSDSNKSVVESVSTVPSDSHSESSKTVVNLGSDSIKSSSIKTEPAVSETCSKTSQNKDCVLIQKSNEAQAVKIAHIPVTKENESSACKTNKQSKSLDKVQQSKTIQRTAENVTKSDKETPTNKSDKETPGAKASDSGETIGDIKRDGQLNFDYLRENSVLEYHWNFNSPLMGPVSDPGYDLFSRFPVAAVSAIVWNPNHRQCLWMAFSGHNGLVHLVNMYNSVPKLMRSFLNDKDSDAGKKS